jgi:hypothetical protein
MRSWQEVKEAIRARFQPEAASELPAPIDLTAEAAQQGHVIEFRGQSGRPSGLVGRLNSDGVLIPLESMRDRQRRFEQEASQ